MVEPLFHEYVAKTFRIKEPHAEVLVKAVTGKESSPKTQFYQEDIDKLNQFADLFSYHMPWAIGAANSLAYHPDASARQAELYGLEAELKILAHPFLITQHNYAFHPSDELGLNGPFALSVFWRRKPSFLKDTSAISFDFDLRKDGKERIFALKGIEINHAPLARRFLKTFANATFSSKEQGIPKVIEHLVPILKKHVERNGMTFLTELPLDYSKPRKSCG